MDNKKSLSRTNSICPSPEDILLDLVKSNKREKLQNLVNENEGLLTFDYPYPYFGRILYIACSELSISPETIRMLLELGAKPTDETEDQGEAIHVAARLTRSDVLKVLTKFLTREEVNHTFKGNNALLILIKEGDYGNQLELLECARVLIKSGINVNHVDFKNLNAVLWAIKKDCKELVEVLLNNSCDLDIDTYTLNGKSARELILSKYSTEVLLPNKLTNKASAKDLLFSYLRAHNEYAFLSFNNGNISEYKDIDNDTYTLLQLSCQLGLLKAVKHLIDNKANLSKTTEKQPHSPLELASENGFHQIVDVLLEHDHALRVSSETLTILLNKMNLSDVDDDNYEKCFALVLKNQDDVSLNTQNSLTQTPLHLAVKFAKPKQVLELLRKGSSLANKNQFDIMPIEYIDSEVLEEHLDECVEINDIDKNNIYVTLNYKTLLPFPLKKEVAKSDCCEEGRDGFIQNPVPETDAIAYMCKAPHLRYLLTHPVIITFLLLKWYKVHRLFLANLLFYTIFLCSLLGYIFASYGNFHYIPNNSSFLSSISSVSYVVLCITFILLLLRETFQILVSPWNYYKDLDNWIEVILLFIVGSILFIADPTNDTRKQMASLAILLSAFELVLMMGQHPRLTTNVVMFKRVSFNFVKFLAWYFLLIAAFALSFYILFSESNEEEQETSTDGGKVEEKEEENNFFINPGVALFKTLVMLTGEFDASDMNFHSFPITSKVIFILFVLMIALILLNLLNGLAVSDTQTIKNDAECVGLIARTEHIHYIESMVLGNILPTTVLNVCQKLCCCLPFYDDLTVILGQPLSKYICLYPRTHVTIPLSNDVEMTKVDRKGSKRESAVSVFNSFYLDKEIRRKIKKVLQKQKTQNSEGYLRHKIKRVEQEQMNIISILQDIQSKLARVESTLGSGDQNEK